jgi:hypothetical protein
VLPVWALDQAQNTDGESTVTYSKEYPLQCFTIIIGVRIRIRKKFEVLVVVLYKIQENGSGLEYNEIVPQQVDEHRDAPIGIQFDKPRFLLCSLGEINRVDAVVADERHRRK